MGRTSSGDLSSFVVAMSVLLRNSDYAASTWSTAFPHSISSPRDLPREFKLDLHWFSAGKRLVIGFWASRLVTFEALPRMARTITERLRGRRAVDGRTRATRYLMTMFGSCERKLEQ